MTAVRTKTYTDQWIGGAWTPSTADSGIDVIDPSTEEVLAVVPAGTAEDARRSVAAASAAAQAWAATPLSQRIAIVGRLIGGLAERAHDLAETITDEVGAPTMIAHRAQVGLALGIAESFLGIADRFPFEQTVANSLVVREPAGVVAAITPWNVPLILTMQKIVPALLAGCTVVHKPSELTPLHALLLAEIAAAADLPAGVFNVVIGDGPQLGAALAADPGVDLVSFTGSVRAGREVAAAGAGSLKRVHLELGGKSASVVLDGADFATAVGATFDQVCFNSGQACLQWSRLLVPADRHDEALELAGQLADRYRVGVPRDADTDLGPLVSAAALARVRGYIAKGIEEGATLAAGGADAVAGLERGYYVRPTVFGNVEESMTIAQEEIFGPVLSIIPYADEQDAIRIANSTPYGLHGAVWAGTDEDGTRVARQIRTGQVDVNGGPFNILAPFGGMKSSGIGRECGIEGFDAFCEIKSIQLPDDSSGPVGPQIRGGDGTAAQP